MSLKENIFFYKKGWHVFASPLDHVAFYKQFSPTSQFVSFVIYGLNLLI